MKKSNFTMVDNEILDSGLSLEALGLYLLIQRHATKKGWEIKRDYFKKISGMGECAFRRIWKELIDKGILRRTIERIKGRFNYIFTLVTGESKKESKKKEVKKSRVDSDNKEPLEGQIHVEEIIEENIEDKLVKETGAKKERVKSAISYAKDKGAKDLYHYALKTIANNWDNYGKVEKSNNANFTQRDYDYNLLEQELLGYSLEDDSIPEVPEGIGLDVKDEFSYGF
ncbi:hypothetical protein PTM93_06010 [Clostridium perfringens]|nr:hypothetical protein [Clostridium perfringens]MDK0409046.1 hypothetical protein [Clostridium perfringens]MDK0443305.1 hypothetical protein [Clostridium perfringens]MDK0496849.1 hypothetical protein [Clostridium perfringens]MDK0499955.1 hypothetical protein [Clostridium perfringens]